MKNLKYASSKQNLIEKNEENSSNIGYTGRENLPDKCKIEAHVNNPPHTRKLKFA